MANEQNLTPFPPGNNANPYGRPKKFVGVVLDELRKAGYDNIKRSQIVDVYETLLVLPKDVLTKIALSDKHPMIYRIIAKEMLSKRGFDIIERMIDRAQGKPVAKTEVMGEGGQPLTINVVRIIDSKKDNDNNNREGNKIS